MGTEGEDDKSIDSHVIAGHKQSRGTHQAAEKKEGYCNDVLGEKPCTGSVDVRRQIHEELAPVCRVQRYDGHGMQQQIHQHHEDESKEDQDVNVP
jgi:hypothetical protein